MSQQGDYWLHGFKDLIVYQLKSTKVDQSIKAKSLKVPEVVNEITKQLRLEAFDKNDRGVVIPLAQPLIQYPSDVADISMDFKTHIPDNMIEMTKWLCDVTKCDLIVSKIDTGDGIQRFALLLKKRPQLPDLSQNASVK